MQSGTEGRQAHVSADELHLDLTSHRDGTADVIHVPLAEMMDHGVLPCPGRVCMVQRA